MGSVGIDVAGSDVVPASGGGTAPQPVHLKGYVWDRVEGLTLTGAIYLPLPRFQVAAGHVEGFGCHVQQQVAHLISGLLHGNALYEGGAAAGGGAGVGGAAGVGGYHADGVGGDAHAFGRDLGHDGNHPLPHLAGAGVDRSGAVLGQLNHGGADVGAAEAVAYAVEHGAYAEASFFGHGLSDPHPNLPRALEQAL